MRNHITNLMPRVALQQAVAFLYTSRVLIQSSNLAANIRAKLDVKQQGFDFCLNPNFQ